MARRNVNTTFTLSREDALYIRQGRETVLAGMNMANDVNPGPQERTRLVPYEQRLEEANVAWSERMPINHIVDVILNLPVRYRTRVNLKGFTMGTLVAELIRRGGDRRVLEGLFFTGTTRDFNTEVYNGPPVQVVGAPNQWVTPKRLRRLCDQVSIRMFPLSKVNPHHPQIEPQDDSFAAFLDELTNTQGGSDLTCYMFWEDCYVYRMHHPPTYISTQVRAVRTGSLSNIITEHFKRKYFMKLFDVNQHLYVPDGSRNCFLAAVEWGIFQSKWSEALKRFRQNPFAAVCDITGMAECSNSSYIEELGVDPVMDSQLLLATLKAHVREEVKCMMEDAVDFVDKASKTSGRRQNKRRKLSENLGFSTQMMNRYVSYFFNAHDILICMYYVKEGVRLRNRLEFTPSSTEEGSSTNPTIIELFQIDDQGFVLSNERMQNRIKTGLDKADNVELSKLVHCACVFPGFSTLFQPENRILVSYALRITQAIEKITTEVFEDIYSHNSLFGFTEYPMDNWHLNSKLESLVEYQNKRYQKSETNTLIFNEKFKGVKSQGAELEFKRKLVSSGRLFANRTMVFAFDLETVPNTTSLQSRVFEPLRADTEATRNLASELASEMEPSLGEIPFSAQWVPVNTSDVGKFAEKKYEILGDNTSLPESVLATFTCDHDLQSEVLDRSVHPTQYEFSGHYILSYPRTEYGDNLFGKCIDDMLYKMAEYAVLNENATDVYAYAHNGHHFDHYLVLLYNYRWPVVRLLITPRGVLSATIQVTVRIPIGDDDYLDSVVRIHLRDTVLHMDGSLDALCAGFKVPKIWKKIDFPIRMVNSDNCFLPEIKNICRPYGENDVKALAYIIVKLNQQIGDLDWEPANPLNNRPPIAQFLTSMGVVRQSTLNHFQKVTKYPEYVNMYGSFDSFRPNAVDIPALRIFIEAAAMGGRVCCMAKSYASSLWGEILSAYMANDKAKLSELHTRVIQAKACKVVQDATSLYPTVQAYCPMPLGGMKHIDRETCWNHINAMACDLCDASFSLCFQHKYKFNSERSSLRPFSIIVVRSVRPSDDTKNNLFNICGRKLYDTSGNPSNIDYSLETSEELRRRFGYEQVIPGVQSYTNIDLYWMHRAGWTFDVCSGIEFDVSMTYNSFIEPAFQKRIEAKIAGNKLQSLALKKMYNGSYGVTIQKDITENFSLVTLPENMRDRSVLEPEIVSHLVHNDCLDASEKLTGESFSLPSGQTLVKKTKIPGIGEYYADQSPLQIGAAILSYARHIMNLIMFNMNQSEQTYTDTDSICLSENAYNLLCTIPGLVNNRDDAPMGSFKNDHAENNGTEPRVVFALYATKKAKLYVTLNQEGDICIFNTFKGLKPTSFVDGKKMCSEHADYIISRSLFEIGINGACQNQLVTSWKRSLSSGITISDHWQRMDSKTYLGHSKGTILTTGPHGNTEFFVPFGSLIHQQYSILHTKKTDTTDEKFEFHPSREQALPAIWNASPQAISDFLDKYYENASMEYVSADPKYLEILEAFRRVTPSSSSGN